MICYDFINEYIQKTIRPESGFIKELGDKARAEGIPVIHPEVTALIRVLGLLLKPVRILEIGTAVGYSAILFSTILRTGGRIDTIERSDTMIEQASLNVRKAGLENVISILPGDAADVLPCLQNKYDLIFLDAAKGQYPDFLPECLRLLEKGGLLVSDNILYKGMIANDELVVRRKKTIVKRMRNYLDTICGMDELETSLIPIGDGVAVSYKVE